MQSPQPVDYLVYLAQLAAIDIHPYGAQATQILLRALDLQPGQCVLEIGCGTGETLRRVARQPNIHLVGVDLRPQMLAMARRRLGWVGLTQRVRLVGASGSCLPLVAESCDRIYSESVLGFQAPPQAQGFLTECWRVLRPGGLYVTNEAIWKSGVSQNRVDRISTSCHTDFGICQASPQAWSIQEWSRLMRQVGFELQATPLIQSVIGQPKGMPNPVQRCVGICGLAASSALSSAASGLFSVYGWLKGQLSPRLRHARRVYRQRLSRHSDDALYIESRLFVLRKPGRRKAE